jgi:hypothetical protein
LESGDSSVSSIDGDVACWVLEPQQREAAAQWSAGYKSSVLVADQRAELQCVVQKGERAVVQCADKRLSGHSSSTAHATWQERAASELPVRAHPPPESSRGQQGNGNGWTRASTDRAASSLPRTAGLRARARLELDDAYRPSNPRAQGWQLCTLQCWRELERGGKRGRGGGGERGGREGGVAWVVCALAYRAPRQQVVRGREQPC